MFGILRRIRGGKLSSSAGSKPVMPPVLDGLEPRILLSGDGLLYDSAPDPLLHSAQLVVQYAELLDANEQATLQPSPKQGIHQRVDSSDQLETDLWQPILPLSAGVSSVAHDGEPTYPDAEYIDASDWAPGRCRFR